jgi:RNA polymerase sigma factor (sigma-70 family)
MSNTEKRRTLFDRLFEQHFRPILAYAPRRVDEPADAADVAAETFLVAWRRIDDVPTGPDARLWLFGTARHVLSNQRRGDHRRGALAERLREELDGMVEADHASDSTPALVRQAMRSVKMDDREILALTCWEGLDPTQAATAMGIPPATARTRLHRARGRMRDALISLGWDADAAPASVAPACHGPAKETL